MGILNDIVKRNTEGKPNRESLNSVLHELYPSEFSSGYGNRIVRMGTYRKMNYEVCTCGTYPYLIITMLIPKMRMDDMMVKDRDGKYKSVTIRRVNPSRGIFNAIIRYNEEEDYMPGTNENGKIHTADELVKDTEWFIDRILTKEYLYEEGNGIWE